MTRETKIGLVIAGSFLCLVSIVVASKMRRNDVPPLDAEESSPTIAANHVGDVKKPQEPEKKPEPSHVPSLFHHQPAMDHQIITPKEPPSMPLHAIAQQTPTPDPVQKELQRLKTENSGQQMPIGSVPAPQVQEPKEKKNEPASVPPPLQNASMPMGLPAFPLPPSGEEKKKDFVEASPSKSPPALAPAPMMIAPPGVEKKDNAVSPLAPLPSAPEAPKEAGKIDSAKPLPSSLKPNEDPVPAPTFIGQENPSPLPKKEEKKNVPAPSAEVFGQVKITDAPPTIPNGLPPLGNNAKEAPKPGFPNDLPPLNQPPKEIAKEAPKIGFPSEGVPVTPLREDPKIGFAPAPFAAPPTIPPLDKQNEPMPQNPAFPSPPAPLRAEVTSPNPVPTIVGKEIPSLPPIRTTPENPVQPLATIPPITIGNTRPAAVVQQTDVEYYLAQPGETNFAALSQRLYGSDKYANALYAYNLDHRGALPSGTNLTASLFPGQKVLNPSRGVLERDYRQQIPNLEPNPIAPVVNSTPPVRLATPAPLNNVVQPQKLAMIPPQNTPPPSAATTDRTQGYVVQNPRGESILDIAERVLGDRSRWHEIYRINPNFRPEVSIPAGTSLRMPVN